MPTPAIIRMRAALETAFAFFPWVISMYVIYWLEYAEIWSVETAHRGKLAVGILVFGMFMSLWLYSYFTRHKLK